MQPHSFSRHPPPPPKKKKKKKKPLFPFFKVRAASRVRSDASLAVSSVVARKPRIAWLYRSPANSSADLVRSLPRVGPELPGLFRDGCPEGLLLALPLRAVFEEVFANLDFVLASPDLVPGRRVVHWNSGEYGVFFFVSS